MGNYRAPERDTITLFTHTHAHPFFYAYAALSVLADRGVGVIGHLGHALPNVAGPVMAAVRDVHHIVDVARSDEEAILKIVESARRSKLSAYHVATQATITDGVYGLARNSHRLDGRYVGSLQKAGKKVRSFRSLFRMVFAS